MMKVFYLTLFFVFFLVTAAAAVVNINTGDMDELTSLPGIGPIKAEAIIKYREEKGLFKEVDDLEKVYGIGKKIIARIKDDVTLGKDVSVVTVTEVTKVTEVTDVTDVSKKGKDAVPAVSTTAVSTTATSSDKK